MNVEVIVSGNVIFKEETPHKSVEYVATLERAKEAIQQAIDAEVVESDQQD